MRPCGRALRASLRRATLVVGPLAIVLVGCTVGDAGDEATAVDFTEVDPGESWTDVAVRLTGCEDLDDTYETVLHLRRSNPVINEVGLAGGQPLAFDPSFVDGSACASDDEPDTEQATAPTSTPEVTHHGGSDMSEGSTDDTMVDDPSVPELDLADDPLADGSFFEPFEDEHSLDRFDFAVHHPVLAGVPIESWTGDHDMSCGPPTATREIDLPGDRQVGDGETYDLDVADVVYWCAPKGPESGHMMTAFNTNSYAQVAFSPAQMFDDVRQVCWDQNMTDLGVRKWTQVIVVGADDFIANDERLDYVSPRVQEGPGAAGVRLTDETFLFEMVQGSTVVHHGQHTTSADFKGFVTEDKAKRYTTCLVDQGDGTIEVTLERDDGAEVRVLEGSFPDGPARVIFQDDTYNAPKSPPKLPVSDPFTWHWDEILVETDEVDAPAEMAESLVGENGTPPG